MSADLPYFKFFVSDWMSDMNVRAMSAAERGIYIDLLALDWKEDGIPEDPEFLARVVGVDADAMRSAWDTLAGRFIPHPEKDGHVTNRRLSKERQEIEAEARKRSEAARKAAKARWSDEEEREDSEGTADAVRPASDPDAIQKSETDTESEDNIYGGSLPDGRSPPGEPAGEEPQDDDPWNARVAEALREHAYPDGEPAGEWTLGRDLDIAADLIDEGYSVQQIEEAVEGVRLMAENQHPAVRGFIDGDGPFTLRVLYREEQGQKLIHLAPSYLLKRDAIERPPAGESLSRVSDFLDAGGG